MKRTHLFLIVAIALWSLSLTSFSAQASVQMGGGGSTKVSSWNGILEDRRLFVSFPQVAFPLPDNAVRYSSVANLCVTSEDGIEWIVDKSPHTPCIEPAPVGLSDRSCRRYGEPILPHRPRVYEGEVCIRHDAAHPSVCIESERRTLTVPTVYDVHVFRRAGGFDGKHGEGGPLGSKRLVLPDCADPQEALLSRQ